ncbi:hypothetical protein QWY31_01815 [Cytophagales bacterium LB-30]|uniref:Protein BatD n=1 Tax=Shiella aurantiaca TaxID=3058365 RepID=A0ABT8F199_9BACT|nr:hypothetical protein [Shiella aurantiaca]MDN4164215.1 hypothetical protein [Shiella aurantiaca]
MGNRKSGILLFLAFFASHWLMAQAPQLQGRFLEDSAEIGRSVHYSFRVQSLATQDIFMPDSSTLYAPFELVSYQYFPTRVDSLYHIDSAVYTLRSFAIDSILYYQLPVYEVINGDSLLYFADTDSLITQFTLLEINDSTQFKTDLAFVPLHYETNWLAIGIVATLTLVGALVLFFLFADGWKARWKQFRLRRRHKRFVKEFDLALPQGPTYSEQEVSKVLHIWKAYLENLEGIPYSRFTTKELSGIITETEIITQLRKADRLIYGKKTEDMSGLPQLKAYATAAFEQKIAQLKHG